MGRAVRSTGLALLGVVAAWAFAGAGCDDGFSCGAAIPNVKVHVLDRSTGRPVAVMPTFELSGNASSFDCAAREDAGTSGSTAPCETWEFPAAGARTLTVGAPGYKSATVSFDAHGGGRPCSQGDPVELTVELEPE